jgi:hypothetical protein
LVGCINDEPIVILIDPRSSNNFLSQELVDKAKLQQVETKVSTILLPNDGTRTINSRVFQTLVAIQGVETRVDFEVWNGVCCDTIIGMERLAQMDANVGCHDCSTIGTLPDGFPFYLTGMRPLPNSPLPSNIQVKRG